MTTYDMRFSDDQTTVPNYWGGYTKIPADMKVDLSAITTQQYCDILNSDPDRPGQFAVSPSGNSMSLNYNLLGCVH